MISQRQIADRALDELACVVVRGTTHERGISPRKSHRTPPPLWILVMDWYWGFEAAADVAAEAAATLQSHSA